MYGSITTKLVDSGFAENQSHYTALNVQPVELMQAIMSPDEIRGYLKGNIIKYAMRQGLKEGEPSIKDYEKMKQYTDWLKEFNETGKFCV